MTNRFSDSRIVESWRRNAPAWSAAVRERRIESRKLVTDKALLDAVLERSPRSVLDIGCGEGWLARELAPKGIRVTGVDVVPGLVEQARSAGGGEFRVASYEEIAAGKFDLSVDIVVGNFAFLGRESVDGVFARIPAMLRPGGSFIVQTLHPVTACGNLPYRDGWREGSWKGCGPGFTEPAPWYFRTLESWKDLFRRSGFQLLKVYEPIHPVTREPASVVFYAT